jgi:hypothetical protein
MSNDLPNQFAGPPGVLFGAAFLREQARRPGLLELLPELKITSAAEAKLLGRGLGSEFTFALQQQRQTKCDDIILRYRQTAGRTDKSMVFEVKERHDRSSVMGSKKRAFQAGRRIGPTANLRLGKYGGENINMNNLASLGNEIPCSQPTPTARFNCALNGGKNTLLMAG